LPVLNVLRTLSRTLPIALDAIWAYRLRSVFTACAVALGIAALTVIVTAVDGAQRMALEIVDMFGPEAAFVLGGDIRSRAVGKRTYTLTLEDAKHIRESLPGVYMVVPLRARRNVPIRAGAKNMVVPVVAGTTADYARVWNWPLSEGRDISPKDVELSAKVGLIGDSVAKELFGNESPIGRTVFVKDFTVQIIGRLAYRGVTGGGGAVDERIIIPLSTLTKRFNMNRKYFRALRVKFHNPEYMDTHTQNLRSLLRRLHGLEQGQDDDFTILTADEILNFISMLKGSLVLFLGITAGVGMLVGGFVLANLFHISVSERTTEIGIRKAMGAKSWAITAQFLTEAALLTLIGAGLGMVLGLGLGQTLSRLGILEIQFSWKVFLLSLASALALAFVFGIKPARRAAAMDPVEALRTGGS